MLNPLTSLNTGLQGMPLDTLRWSGLGSIDQSKNSGLSKTMAQFFLVNYSYGKDT